MDYPDKTMYEMVLQTSYKYPGYDACSFLGTKVTFRELIESIKAVALFLEKQDIKKGDVVTICLPNTPHAVIAFYALNKIGVVANLVHPLTPQAELVSIIEKTKSKALFVLNAFMPKYKEVLSDKNQLVISCSITEYLGVAKSLGFFITKGRKIKKVKSAPNIVSWSKFVDQGKIKNVAKKYGNVENEKYQRPIEPDECALYLHSGGTTADPKTIMLSSKNMNTLAVQGPSIVGIKNPQGMKMASILPLFHGFGLCMGMHTMMVNGIEAVLVPQFNSDSLSDLLKKEKPNFVAGVPTLLEGIMKNKKIKNQDLSYIKAVFCGGDTLTEELKTRFDDFLRSHNCGVQVREGYGLTETVTVCSVNPIEKNKANSIGVPLADIKMKIVKPNTKKELPVGESGEICVSGPTVMLGYLNDTKATKETLKIHEDKNTYVHTGDYGYMDDEGYFYFTQRMKRIIKVSGMPVFPSQIESIIAKFKQVRQVSVIGIPHPYKMHVVKAYISLTDDENIQIESLKEDILQECSKYLIKHAIPVDIEVLDELPKTKVGKIDVLELEKMSQEK